MRQRDSNMAAEYEAILRKIQEGLAQKSEAAEVVGGNSSSGGGGYGGEVGGTTGLQPPPPQLLPPTPSSLFPQAAATIPPAEPPPPPPPELLPLLPSSPSLKALYDHICQRIRSTGSLEVIMKEFQVGC